LDYINIDPTEFGFQGKSLKPVIQKEKAINPYSFCVQHNWRSINDGRFKLIINVKTGAIAFYDLQKDPHEKKNILDIEAETARQHVKALREWIFQEEADLTQEERIRLSEEAIEKLKALGYFK
jgi:K+/H+ antiporter YhaU regulatory subunit KhtT